MTPYLDKELLKDNALSVDGSKVDLNFTKIESLGFKYNHPEITLALVVDVIDQFVALNVWPKGTK